MEKLPHIVSTLNQYKFPFLFSRTAISPLCGPSFEMAFSAQSQIQRKHRVLRLQILTNTKPLRTKVSHRAKPCRQFYLWGSFHTQLKTIKLNNIKCHCIKYNGLNGMNEKILLQNRQLKQKRLSRQQDMKMNSNKSFIQYSEQDISVAQF